MADEVHNPEFIRAAVRSMERRGTKGEFTRKAKAAGMGVQEYARHVLANKERYDAKTRKQAAFAKAMGTIAKRRK